MGAPDLIPGGPLLNYQSMTSREVEIANKGDPSYGHARGQFGRHPASTPKWAINNGKTRDNEFRETMARLFVQMSNEEREPFVASCPPETRELAKVLCGVDSAASGGTGFMDFILQRVDETFQEKYQVVETLSDNFIIYCFGQRATPFTYSGMLYNTWQDDQRVWMLRMYRDILRGTQLARRRKLVRIRYDSVIVSGVLLSLTQSIQGDLIDGVPFSFVLQPTHYIIFTQDIAFPTELKTAFTEAASLLLPSTAVPDMSQLRVASPTRGQIPDADKKRQNEKTDSPYAQPKIEGSAPPVTPQQQTLVTARDQLLARANAIVADPLTEGKTIVRTLAVTTGSRDVYKGSIATAAGSQYITGQ